MTGDERVMFALLVLIFWALFGGCAWKLKPWIEAHMCAICGRPTKRSANHWECERDLLQ